MTDNLSLFRRITAVSSIIVAGLSMGACASAPTTERLGSPTPEPYAKCTSPTLKSTLAVVASAAAGRAIDSKTGGGRGFEQLLSVNADQIAHGCKEKDEEKPAAPAPK